MVFTLSGSPEIRLFLFAKYFHEQLTVCLEPVFRGFRRQRQPPQNPFIPLGLTCLALFGKHLPINALPKKQVWGPSAQPPDRRLL